jgi:hypothetical protein
MSTPTSRRRSTPVASHAEAAVVSAGGADRPSPRALALSIGLGAAIAVGGGCSVVRPEARAKSLEIDRVSGDLAEVDLVIELRNPGKDEIELVQYDYDLSTGDGARYSGRWAALRALPPGQTLEARIPAVLPAASLAANRSWSASGTLRYRDPSSIVRILYEAGILKTEIGFGGSGAGAVRAASPEGAAEPSPATGPAAPASSPAAAPATPTG